MKQRINFILLIVMMYASGLEARPVYLFLRNESHSREYVRGDVGRSLKKSTQIVEQIFNRQPKIEGLDERSLPKFLYLDTSEQYQSLEQQMKSFLDPNEDTIVGVILLGHGARNLFTFSNEKEVVDGQSLGQFVFKLVSLYSVSSRLEVYLGACFSDCKTWWGRKSLSGEFAGGFLSLAQKESFPLDFELSILAHSRLSGEKTVTAASLLEKKISRFYPFLLLDMFRSLFLIQRVEWFSYVFWGTFALSMLFVPSQEIRNYALMTAIPFFFLLHKTRFATERHVTKRIYDLRGQEIAIQKGDLVDFISTDASRRCARTLKMISGNAGL